MIHERICIASKLSHEAHSKVDQILNRLAGPRPEKTGDCAPNDGSVVADASMLEASVNQLLNKICDVERVLFGDQNQPATSGIGNAVLAPPPAAAQARRW